CTGTDFLDRADANTISLTQGTVDRSGLRDTHFGTMHQGRDVGRIGITKANETSTSTGLEHCSFEYPTRVRWIAGLQQGPRMNPNATTAISKSHEPRMSYIPASVEIDDVSLHNREGTSPKQFFEHANGRFRKVSA
ncbi:MAG: hypothetical protein DMG46_25640, partial [Acidobacteria bacterium]